MLYSDWLAEGVPAGKHELRFECPKCGETKKKFYWNTKYAVGHCFICGYAANPLQLVRDVGLSFRHTPPSLSEVEAALDGEEDEHEHEPSIPATGSKDCLLKLPGVSIFKSIQGIAYMLSRGVRPVDMRRYKMRYDSSYPARIILPVCNWKGQIVGWTGRATNKFVQPKYKTSPGFSISKHLFGIQFAQLGAPEVVIVEGPLDQIRYGKGAVATFGKHMSKQQKRLLVKRMRPFTVVIMWDSDAKEEAKKLAVDLGRVFNIKLVLLPEGKDPGSMRRKELREIVKRTPTYKSTEWLASELATFL